MRTTLTIVTAFVLALSACDATTPEDASSSEESELRRRPLAAGVTSVDPGSVAAGDSFAVTTTYKILRAPSDTVIVTHALVAADGTVLATTTDRVAPPIAGPALIVKARLAVPAGTPPGPMAIATRAESASGSVVYQTSASAATVTITEPVASAADTPITVTPAMVGPGATIDVRASLVAPRTADGIVAMMQVVDEKYAVVAQYVAEGQHVEAGKATTLAHGFTLPTPLAAGRYYVSAGLFSADWSETLTYRDRGASFDVTTSGGASPGSPGPLVPTYPPSLALTPAFHEEFDGDLATQWVDHEPYWGPPGTAAYGNGSWFQAPAGSLAEVAGGIATLRNRACTNPGGFTMCGPDLSTRGKFETFVHGHVEARVKLPGNAGGWPGFWLMGNGLGDQAWPKTGEIDIFELVNNGRDNGIAYFTVHWSCPQDQWGHCQKTYENPPRIPSYTDAYHVWSFTRTQDLLESRIDGVLAAQISRAELAAIGGDYDVLFNGPMHVRLDLANGGPWAADPSKPPGEGDFLVDYVRVWSAP